VPKHQEGFIKTVFFCHKPRFSLARYEAYYQCPVIFEHDFNGIRFCASALKTPTLAADQRMAAYFKTVAERYEVDMGKGDDIVASVQRLFIQRMAFGETDLKGMSHALAMSMRSLQQQLKEAGTNYRQVT
jgi:hypothetical protein